MGVDIAAALRQASADGAIWSAATEQLNANLLLLPAGSTIAEHVNAELDVLLAVFEGSGEIVINGVSYALGAGMVLVVPRGARRAIRCTAGPLVYLTCHRRRGGLMPEFAPQQRRERRDQE